MNTLDERVLELIQSTLERAARDFAGLVVTGAGEHFSAGANVNLIAAAIQARDWAALDRGSRALQDTLMALRYNPQPVVVAPFGYCLGAGAELAMSGARIVASAETYLGLPEVGIGWIPDAGGCKELLRRVVSPAALGPGADPRPALERVFELIGQGKVSGSAAEARGWGYLSPSDRVVMNRDHLLATAKREVLDLVGRGYQPPVAGKIVYAAGRDALAALKIRAYLAHEAGYATDYDLVIANHLAHVLCGGDLSEPQWVDESYLLALERQAAIELAQQPKTLERVKFFLETGKTVRN
jgi:3-hydroxyacyl-CoA dehydrogenase